MVIGGGEVAKSQICGSITMIDRPFKPKDIVMGSPAGVMGSNHSKIDRRSSLVGASWLVVVSILPALIMIQLALLMRVLRRFVPACFTLCAYKKEFDQAGVGFLTGVIQEVDDLENTLLRSSMLGAAAYFVVLLTLSALFWGLIWLCRFNHGRHRLKGPSWILWLLAGRLQGLAFQFFGLFVRGTPLMRTYLRFFGSTIGERVFWDALPPVETRALIIEDDVVVEEGAMLYGHVVDHEQLQYGTIRVGQGTVINGKVNVQPHTNIGSNVMIGCLTTVSKYETLPDNTAWQGSPAVLQA
jgi:acetyltransferase-like isoleucine patch superfamily enzyme